MSFAIADGIQPGNNDRNYVLRRILRRAVRYGRTLGFHEPFFYKLVSVLADTMGHVFPEIRAKQDHIEEVIQREEEAFNRTLDRGIELFDNGMLRRQSWPSARLPTVVSTTGELLEQAADSCCETAMPTNLTLRAFSEDRAIRSSSGEANWRDFSDAPSIPGQTPSSFTTPTASRSTSPS